MTFKFDFFIISTSEQFQFSTVKFALAHLAILNNDSFEWLKRPHRSTKYDFFLNQDTLSSYLFISTLLYDRRK